MNIAVLRKIVILVISVLIIYLYAFNPIFLPIGSFGLLKLTYLFLFSYFFKDYRAQLVILQRPLVLYFFIIVYTVLIVAIGSNFIYFRTQLVDLIELFLLPTSLSYFLIKKNIDLSRVLFIVAAIATLITMYAYLSPSFLFIIRSVQPEQQLNDYALTARSFGFSSELTFGYGCALGLICVYYLFSSSKNKWFIFLMPFVFLAIMLNARTGGVVILIGVVCYLFMKRTITFFFRITFLVLIILFLISKIDFAFLSVESIDFIQDFFDQMLAIAKGDFKDTYIDTYATSHIVLPDTFFQWIFGRGNILFRGASGAASSDIGYFNDLSLGGLIYICLLYLCYFVFLKKTPKRWLFISFCVISLILNIKGMYFHTNGCLRIMFLIVLYEYMRSIQLSKLRV